MAQLVIEKRKIFYDLLKKLNSENGPENGFTEKELLENLNKNNQHSAWFSTYYSLNDFIESSLRLKRLEKKADKFYLTSRGEDHANYLQQMQ